VVPENIHTYHKEGSWELREVSYAKNLKRNLMDKNRNFQRDGKGKGKGV